jgi:D-serine deaminase-like pyridoxal phosphate-dependent protein
VLDLDAFERNLARMQAAADAAGVALRPHAKAHKCPAIALAQIERGAVGICCQKVSEAVPFVAAGVRDIHVSNEIVAPAKAALLARLALRVRASVCVDDLAQIEVLAAATAAAGSRLDVLVEIDVGQNRCGVATPDAVRRLVDGLSACAGLRFAGLQAYQGSLQHLRGHGERREAAARAADRAVAAVDALAHSGVACPVVTGGGSGSVEFDLGSGVYTEVQPGSYVFMDGDYGRNEYTDALRFEHALFVATTVISTGGGQHEGCIVDAGLKSLAVDSGLPDVWNGEHDYVAVSDEHGTVHPRTPSAARLGLGARLLLVPGHCDPTVNLHDELIGLRGTTVEAIWPIAARGLSR